MVGQVRGRDDPPIEDAERHPVRLGEKATSLSAEDDGGWPLTIRGGKLNQGRGEHREISAGSGHPPARIESAATVG